MEIPSLSSLSLCAYSPRLWQPLQHADDGAAQRASCQSAQPRLQPSYDPCEGVHCFLLDFAHMRSVQHAVVQSQNDGILAPS